MIVVLDQQFFMKAAIYTNKYDNILTSSPHIDMVFGHHWSG